MERELYRVKRSDGEIYGLAPLELVDGKLPAMENYALIGISVKAYELVRLDEPLPLLGHDGDNEWRFVTQDGPYPSNLVALLQLMNPGQIGLLINCTLEQALALCETYDTAAT